VDAAAGDPLGLEIQGTPETAALDERFLRDRLAEVALQFLYRSLSGRPTIFVIEDVQFLDEASRDLLTASVDGGDDVRQILLLTRQGAGVIFELEAGQDDFAGTPVMTLELGPLSLAATISLVEAATEDARCIGMRSKRSLSVLAATRVLVRAPRTVRARARSKRSPIRSNPSSLGRSTTWPRRIGRSCVMRPCSEQLRPRPAGSRGASRRRARRPALGRLSDLIEEEPGGERRFRNTLIRDAAYEGLPYRRRRALHDRVAQTIEARSASNLDEEVGTLAVHYFEAQRWDKAWEFCPACRKPSTQPSTPTSKPSDPSSPR
jgi:hypothetical protein